MKSRSLTFPILLVAVTGISLVQSSDKPLPCYWEPLYGKIIPEGGNDADSSFLGPLNFFEKGSVWDCIYQPMEHCAYYRVFNPNTNTVQYYPCDETFPSEGRFVFLDSTSAKYKTISK